MDECGNTAGSYNWTVPSGLDIGTLGETFNLIATNKTSSNIVYGPGSEEFNIKQILISRSSTKSGTSTLIPNSTSTPAAIVAVSISASTSAPSPTTTTAPQPPTNGLSTSGQAGIGTGCAIIGLLIILGTLISFKRRRSDVSKENISGTGNAFEKPESEGREAQKQLEEIGRNEVLEVGSNKAPIRELDGRDEEGPPAELETR